MTEENTTGNEGGEEENSNDGSKNQEAAMARISAQRDTLKAENEKLMKASKKETGEFNPEDFKKQVVAEVKRDGAINSFVKKNSEFADYEDTVRGLYEQGKISGDIKADQAFYLAAGEKLMSIGAAKKQKADADAKGEKTGGTSKPSGNANGDDPSKLSPEQFRKQLDSVLANQ
jgi:hypothetical protein